MNDPPTTNLPSVPPLTPLIRPLDSHPRTNLPTYSIPSPTSRNYEKALPTPCLVATHASRDESTSSPLHITFCVASNRRHYCAQPARRPPTILPSPHHITSCVASNRCRDCARPTCRPLAIPTMSNVVWNLANPDLGQPPTHPSPCHHIRNYGLSRAMRGGSGLLAADYSDSALRAVRVVASLHVGRFVRWPVRMLAGSYVGRFVCWPVRTLAG